GLLKNVVGVNVISYTSGSVLMRVAFAASCADVAGLTFVGASQFDAQPSDTHVHTHTGLVSLFHAKLSNEVPVTSTLMVTGSSALGKDGIVVTVWATARDVINK